MAFLATSAATSPLTQSVVDRTQAKGLTGDWGAQVQRLIETRVYPALAAQNAVLKAAQPGAVHEASVRRLPQGEQYYANSLRYITTTRLTADELHRTGVEQMAELTARADGLLKAQGLTQGSVAQRIAALGDDPKYIYANTDAGKAELIAKLNAQMADMQARLPKRLRPPAQGQGRDQARAARDRGRRADGLLQRAQPGWDATRHLLDQSEGHGGMAVLVPADPDLSRGHAGPPSADQPAAGKRVRPPC